MADDKGGKPDEKTNTPPSAPPAGPDVAELTKRVEALTAELSSVKDEAIQRRKDNKALKEQLAQAAGIPAENVNLEEKLAEREKAVRQQMAQSFGQRALSAAVEREAAKLRARNPGAVSKLVNLDGIEVDPETWDVKDADALAKRFKALVESDPYLFQVDEPAPGGKPATPKPTPGPGRPDLGGKGSAFEQWQAALAAGDIAGAKVVYDANKPAIGAVIDTHKPH